MKIAAATADTGGRSHSNDSRELRSLAEVDAMKITQLETLRLPEHPNIVWVRIHTARRTRRAR